jgi:molybdenum cofactor guanylyltransferase
LSFSVAEGLTADGDALGFVLAGGRSSRMGRDKALVELAGAPLLWHALRTFREAGLEASIAGGQAELADSAPLVADCWPGTGPLGGICSALAASEARWSVFLPIDMPFLPANLLLCLLSHAAITGRLITIASVGGFAESFPVVIDHAALPVLELELAAGRNGCFRAFQAAAEAMGEPVTGVAVEHLVQCGQVRHPAALPACRWFLNVNTAENLRRAESLHAAHRLS